MTFEYIIFYKFLLSIFQLRDSTFNQRTFLHEISDCSSSIQLSPNNYTALKARPSRHPKQACLNHSLTPRRLSSTPTPVPARVDLEEMSAIDASDRCGSAMEWSVDNSTDANLRGPFSSTMMYPSRSTPRHMRKRTSTLCNTSNDQIINHNQQDISKSPVCRLEFHDLDQISRDEEDTTILEDMDNTNGVQLKRLISDKVMSLFNFVDSDDSMDTHVDSLHTPTSSTSSLTSVENNEVYPPHGPSGNQMVCQNNDRATDNVVSTTMYKRPQCLGGECTSVAQTELNRKHLQHLAKGTSAVTKCSQKESNRKQEHLSQEYITVASNGVTKCSQKVSARQSHQKSSESKESSLSARYADTKNDTVNSDSTSFMQKPLCKRGVAKSHMDKSRKRSILSKLKKIGRHLHQGKTTSCTEQMETLAVL